MTDPSGIGSHPPPQAIAVEAGAKLLLLDSVDSTMLEAERLFEAGSRGPLVIVAREQTGGAGRHGRRWASPPGNLYWTCLLDEGADRPRDAGLAFAGGLAVRDALVELGVAAARLRLKWPNDVMFDGGKVAGVLARTSVIGPRACAVVGIGVNLASAPADTAYPAAALPALPIDGCRVALTRAFFARCDQWRRDGVAALARDADAVLHGRGEPIRVALDRDRTEVVEGAAVGLEPSGALRLRMAGGEIRTIVAGDILA